MIERDVLVRELALVERALTALKDVEAAIGDQLEVRGELRQYRDTVLQECVGMDLDAITDVLTEAALLARRPE